MIKIEVNSRCKKDILINIDKFINDISINFKNDISIKFRKR